MRSSRAPTAQRSTSTRRACSISTARCSTTTRIWSARASCSTIRTPRRRAAAAVPLARSADFFSFLGLPRKLNVDMADLEQRYRALSRQFHPDYFYNAPPAERRASLEQSSYLNDAYRALKNPVSRIEYLLQVEGVAPKSAADSAKQV